MSSCFLIVAFGLGNHVLYFFILKVADIKRMNGLTSDLQMFSRKSLRIPSPGRFPPSPVVSNGCHTQGYVCFQLLFNICDWWYSQCWMSSCFSHIPIISSSTIYLVTEWNCLQLFVCLLKSSTFHFWRVQNCWVWPLTTI